MHFFYLLSIISGEHALAPLDYVLTRLDSYLYI